MASPRAPAGWSSRSVPRRKTCGRKRWICREVLSNLSIKARDFSNQNSIKAYESNQNDEDVTILSRTTCGFNIFQQLRWGFHEQTCWWKNTVVLSTRQPTCGILPSKNMESLITSTHLGWWSKTCVSFSIKYISKDGGIFVILSMKRWDGQTGILTYLDHRKREVYQV